MSVRRAGLRPRPLWMAALLLALTFTFTGWSAPLARAADPIDAQELVEARDAVLSRPEFTYEESTDSESFLTRAFRSFMGFLRDLQQNHPVLFGVILVGLFLLLVLLVAHIVWTIRVAGRVEYADERLELEDALRRADPAPFRERALQLAAEGDLEAAVQSLYIALLLTLERRGYVRYARHKALLDYQLETAEHGDVRATLDLFSDVYHPGSFGRRPPDRARFDSMVAALDGLPQGVPQERPA